MSILPLNFEAALQDLRVSMANNVLGPAIEQMVILLDGGGSAQQWLQAGEEIGRSGQPLAAAAVLERGLVRWPTATSMRYMLGNMLRLSGRPQEAERALRAVLAAEPMHVQAHLSLAFLLREQGRLSAAAEVIVQLWRRQARSRDTDLRTVKFLQECQRHQVAEEIAEDILALHPHDSEVLALLGENALVLGRFGAAQRRLRAAVEIDPERPSAWLRLSHTHKFSAADDADLVLFEQASERKDYSDETRVCIEFSLGKARDDLGDRAGAVAAWRAANRRWRAKRPWDVYGWERYVETQRKAPVLPAATGPAEQTPVFIVGMPRSGTTLVASLLGRNQDVKNRNELNWISGLAVSLGPNPTRDALASAGRVYRAHLVQDDEPARVYLDKNPLNFRHLRLIAAMLPNARIIHCRRDPLDTAMSLWNQHFAHEEMGWAYDFGDIAAYYRGYQALLQHWRETLPVPVFDLDYEAMVADSGASVARLVKFLEIGEVQRETVPNEAIATASVWQARQSVYASSVGRWREYEALLPELVAAFG